MTQTYADFDIQIRHVLAVDEISEALFDGATEHAIQFALRGCGLDRAAPQDTD
jgi:hypothetical protein